MSLATAALAVSMATVSVQGAVSCPTTVVHQRYVPVAESTAFTAVTYDMASVPRASAVTVVSHGIADGGTRVKLRLHGVEPNRTFGAHVHTKPCGAAPADAGPHYQDVNDPVQPSVDPAYANPGNEVWLDFTSDERGDGGTTAAVDWRFRAGEARSLIVHEHATDTHEGHAGTAGDRLACVNVPFG